MNNTLENALKETWELKEKFHENYKGLSMLETLKMIEKKYTVRGTAYNRTVCASPPYGGSGYEKPQSG